MFKLILLCLVLFIFNPIQCSIDCIVKVKAGEFNTTGIFIRNDLLIVLNTFINRTTFSKESGIYTYPDICIFNECIKDFSIATKLRYIGFIKFYSFKHNCSYPTLYTDNTFPDKRDSKTKICGFDKDNVTCSDLRLYTLERNRIQFYDFIPKSKAGFPIFLNYSNVEYLLSMGEELPGDDTFTIGDFIDKNQIDNCLNEYGCMLYNYNILIVFSICILVLVICALLIIIANNRKGIYDCCRKYSNRYRQIS